MMMGDAWKRYASDFDAMTDEEVATQVTEAQNALDEAEDWLEAVASWEAAGKPRSEESE